MAFIAGHLEMYMLSPTLYSPLMVQSSFSLVLKVKVKVKLNSPIPGLDSPRGLQEVKVPRFHDNGTGWW